MTSNGSEEYIKTYKTGDGFVFHDYTEAVIHMVKTYGCTSAGYYVEDITDGCEFKEYYY